ncbi:uncharacterized protein G2W53_013527 [Senna tora]|uniref:Uncharacterized protein n=1 Tax=Senna tora TaxID=362788 RepID=A0A834U4J6_9FABA|nr:uncharacterized protein G2W53_013527 [Senna tora]
MEEKAKQELEMLESQYPNHFDYLKLELKSFIFQLQCQQQHLPETSTSHSSIAITQESTSLNQRKKRKSTHIDEGSDSSEYSGKKKKKKSRRSRVDEVLERAQACLEKIRHFKKSFLSNS